MNLERGSDLASMYQPGGLLKLPRGGRGRKLSLEGKNHLPKDTEKGGVQHSELEGDH